MKYGITLLRLDVPDSFYEISEDEYHEIIKSQNNLYQILNIEEKFNIIIENYKEFETELLNISVNQMLFPSLNRENFSNQRNDINRRIINLLTACRLYLDHVPHHLNNIFGKGHSVNCAFKEKTSEEFDSHFSYRVMEALRNFVQHRGFPIHICSYTMKKIETEGKSQFLYMMAPQILVEELELDKKFRTATLAEMRSVGDKIDIRPLVRKYIEAIGRLHIKLRNNLKDRLKGWEQKIINAYDSFKSQFGDDVSGIAVVSKNENGSYFETKPLADFIIEQRLEFEKKNQQFKGLSLKYATNQIFI